MTDKKLLVAVKPHKPINEMTDAERDAFAAQVVGDMQRAHEQAPQKKS